MDREKLKTLSELIKNFSTKYYSDENDKLKKEIKNINDGRPRHAGIPDKYSKYIVPSEQRETETKKLRSKIEDNEKKRDKLDKILHKLRTSVDDLEKLAKQDMLFELLENTLNLPSLKMESKGYTDTEKKYRKLYFKSQRKISNSRDKISKKMYNLIKKSQRRYFSVNKIFNERKRGFDYQSITTALEENKINLYSNIVPGILIKSDYEKKYATTNYPYVDLSSLGVDMHKIQYLKRLSERQLDTESLTWGARECFEKLEFLKQLNIDESSFRKVVEDLKTKYEEIIELSRQIWYIEETLSAFSTTSISDSLFYKGLKDIVQNQKETLDHLIKEADKIYEKHELEKKEELNKQLDQLHGKLKEKEIEIDNCQKIGNSIKASVIRQEYYELRYEMVEILRKNPELNKIEYGIDSDELKRKKIEPLESEEKKEEVLYNRDNKIDDKTPYKVDVDTPKKADKTPYEEVTESTEGNELSENEIVAKDVYITYEMREQRKTYYQYYMWAKIDDKEVREMSFSEYLFIIAPHLTELIEIEKRREMFAKTIYKEYLKYYASLENKNDAINFQQFATEKYGISIIEVPEENKEEYEGMISK